MACHAAERGTEHSSTTPGVQPLCMCDSSRNMNKQLWIEQVEIIRQRKDQMQGYTCL